MGKVVNLGLVVEEKVFINKENGETVNYYAVGTIINGEYIKLSVPKESKSLFNYLISQIKE